MTLPALQVAQTRSGRLGYVVSGQGRPHMVLVNGAGMSLEGWDAVYPELERLGTVFAYNRFGVKASDPPARPQTGALVVAALRELLGYAGVEPPYVLVGHSLGCLHAELFARLHPREVCGLLLIEPTCADEPEALVEREDEFAHGTGKALGLPAAMVEDNLKSELRALEGTLCELDSAGSAPAVAREVLRGQGHFPQLTRPGEVLAALRRVIDQAAWRTPTLL